VFILKGVVKAIISGILVIFISYIIVVDEIAISASSINALGYSLNFSAYTNINITKDYMKVLKGFLEIYSAIGAIIIDLLSNHASEVFSSDISRGSPTRFMVASLLPFIMGIIFAGLMADDVSGYIVSAVLTAILSPIIGFVFYINFYTNASIDALISAIQFAVIGLAFGFLPGLIFNFISIKSFEKKEKEEEEEGLESDVEIDFDEEIEI